MARKLRVEYEGAIYHVMNRGDRREAIFLDEEDRKAFLTTLRQACAKTGWQIPGAGKHSVPAVRPCLDLCNARLAKFPLWLY